MEEGIYISIHRSLLVRLITVGVLVSLGLGIAAGFFVRYAMTEYASIDSIERAKLLADELAPTMSKTERVDPAEIRVIIEEYTARQAMRHIGSFVFLRIFDTSGKEVTTLSKQEHGNITAVAQFMDKSGHPAPNQETSHEIHRLKGHPYFYMVVPLIDKTGRRIGTVDGMFAFSTEAVADLRGLGVKAMVGVAVVVIIISLILYPVIIRLNRRVVGLSRDLLEANLEIIAVLGSAIAKRDSDTDAHNFRVTIYSVRLAEKAGLDRQTIRTILKGAFLHDVGKIGIRDGILLKPGKLDEQEFNIMKTHISHGTDIVKRSKWLEDARQVVQYHQEKYDGSGYMGGLSEGNIPVSARIFAIADVFDALTSKRPYKDPFPLERTLEILREGEGNHFDPDFIRVFLTIAPSLYDEYANRDDEKLRQDLRDLAVEYFSGDVQQVFTR